MDAEKYISSVRDQYEISSKLLALRDAAIAAENSGNNGVFLLASGRVRQWEALQARRWPFEAILILNHLSQNCEYGAEITALAVGSGACALAQFAADGAGAQRARAQLSQILGRDMTTSERVAQFKVQQFSRGLGLALGCEFSHDEEAYVAAANYEIGTSGGAASYCAVGLANELREAGDFSRAFEILSHVTKRADPQWIRPQFFFVEYSIRAFAETGSEDYLEEAADSCRLILSLSGCANDSDQNSRVAERLLTKLKEHEVLKPRRQQRPEDHRLGIFEIDSWTGQYIV